MSQLVCVQEYLDRMSAEIGRAMLQAHGIGAHVQGDDMGGTRPDLLPIGRVRLLVQSADEQDARALLVTVDEHGPDDRTESLAPQPEYKKDLRRGFYAAVLGLLILPPVFMHAYALWLMMKVLPHWRELSGAQKAQVVITTGVSLAVFSAVVVYFAGGF